MLFHVNKILPQAAKLWTVQNTDPRYLGVNPAGALNVKKQIFGQERETLQGLYHWTGFITNPSDNFQIPE